MEEKLKQKDKKALKRTKCEYCAKDKRKNLSYYRNCKYYCNKGHWKKQIKKQKEKKNVTA